MRKSTADILLDLYIRLFLRIDENGTVYLSLLANILIGIGCGIAGCLLLMVADAQLSR